MFIPAECFQINKYRVSFHLSGILYTQVTGIGEHGHDFLLYIRFAVGQINTVIQGFAHLCLPVNTRQAQTYLVVRQQDIRVCKCFPIYGIELVDDFPSSAQSWAPDPHLPEPWWHGTR